MNADFEARREEALARLELFLTRILPGTIRRIAAWKGIPRGQIPDLTDELRQELSVDCLEHCELVVALPQPQRHSRWMRAAERWVYHHHLGHGRRRSSSRTVPDDTPAPAIWPSTMAAEVMRRPHVVTMGNGRLNLTASAQKNGKEARAMQHELEHVATRLGCDEQYHAFWRQRLAEALTGLAADLLRDRGVLCLLGRSRPAPNPGTRLRRIRRIAARFHVRPATLEVRRVLRQWVRRPHLDEHAPRRLLQHATGLCPADARAWMWLFEACFVEADLPSAARAIRACRNRPGGERVGSTLARARLLEARSRWPAALALIRRATRRWPHEPRLQHVHDTLTASSL